MHNLYHVDYRFVFKNVSHMFTQKVLGIRAHLMTKIIVDYDDDYDDAEIVCLLM